MDDFVKAAGSRSERGAAWQTRRFWFEQNQATARLSLQQLWAQLSPAERRTVLDLCKPCQLCQLRLLLELRLKCRAADAANRQAPGPMAKRREFVCYLIATRRLGDS